MFGNIQTDLQYLQTSICRPN